MLALQQHGLHLGIIMDGNGRGVTRSGLPLIHTYGEKRLSDFLLWECAYAEFVFTDRMWRANFNRRQGRFGAIPDAVLTIAGGTR